MVIWMQSESNVEPQGIYSPKDPSWLGPPGPTILGDSKIWEVPTARLPKVPGVAGEWSRGTAKLQRSTWVCLKIVSTPKPNGFADHYPYEKWLFHWEYTQHFQTNPHRKPMNKSSSSLANIMTAQIWLSQVPCLDYPSSYNWSLGQAQDPKPN